MTGRASGRWTRRRLIASAGAVGLLAAPRGARAQDGSLAILSVAALSDQAFLDRFVQATGRDVRSELAVTDDEIVLRLRAGGVGRVDVTTPTNGAVVDIARAGLLQPLDLNRLPAAAGLLEPFRSPAWARLDGADYAVPIVWRSSPLALSPAASGDPPGTWLELFDERWQGRLVMMEEGLSHLITWNRALGFPDPVRVSRDQLTQTTELLRDLKGEQVSLFTGNPQTAVDALLAERSLASTAGNEWIARDGRIPLVHLEPGDFSVCLCAAIPAGAPDLDAAYAFIDFLLNPETQAFLAGRLGQRVVAEPAVPLLDDQARARGGYDDFDRVFAVSPLVGLPPFADQGDDTATYLDWVLAWDRVRVAPTRLERRPTPTPRPSPTPEAGATPTPSD